MSHRSSPFGKMLGEGNYDGSCVKVAVSLLYILILRPRACGSPLKATISTRPREPLSVEGDGD
jgi:hypothetical protein